jgi:hypothetical protein
LKLAEEAARTRESHRHGPKFAKNLVPVLGGSPLLGAGDGVEDDLEALSAVQGKFQRHGFGVEEPAKHELPSGPVGVSLLELFDRNGLLACRVVVVAEGTKQAINGVQKDTANSSTTLRGALDHTKVIVDIDVELREDPGGSLEVRKSRIRGGWKRDRRDRRRRRRVGLGDQIFFGEAVASGLKAMGRQVADGPEEHGVSDVSTGLGDHREPRRRFDPPHGKSQRESHQSFLGISERRKD